MSETPTPRPDAEPMATPAYGIPAAPDAVPLSGTWQASNLNAVAPSDPAQPAGYAPAYPPASTPSWTPTADPSSYADAAPGAVAAPEIVGKGLMFALGGVVLGAAFTAILWKFGIQWSFTSFVLAAASVALYRMGSGGQVRKGVLPLVVLILLGTVASFFVCVAVDAYTYFTDEALDGSPWEFILDNIFRPKLLAAYGKDIAFFLLFAGLGTFSTLRGLLGARQATS